MKNYQFRTNWLGQLVLQCQDWLPTHFGDREYYWRDAETQDLKQYYATVALLSQPVITQRDLFEAECG